MKKLIAFAVVVIIVVFGGGLLLTAKHKKPNVFLDLSPAPSKVVLDNKSAVGASFYASPGKHTVTVSFSGFADSTQAITVKAGKTTHATILLQPNSGAGRQWLIAHPDEQNKRQTVVGQAFESTTQKRIDKLPLIQDLPYIERYFRIDYGPSKQHPDDSTASALYITTYGQPGVQQALDWIRSQGYNPDTLEIIYSSQSS